MVDLIDSIRAGFQQVANDMKTLFDDKANKVHSHVVDEIDGFTEAVQAVGGGSGGLTDIRPLVKTDANSGLTKTDNADGSVNLRLAQPDSMTNFAGVLGYVQNPDGSWPAMSRGIQYLVGFSLPPVTHPNLVDGVASCLIRPQNVPATTIMPLEFAAVGPSTNTWSWTMPAGIPDNTIAAVQFHHATYSTAHTYTLTVDGVVIPQARPLVGASGYTALYYTFATSASMSGKTITLSATTTATHSSVRVVGVGGIFKTSASAVPVGSSSSTVGGTPGSTTNRTKTGPTYTSSIDKGYVFEIDFVSGVGSVAPPVADWAPQSGWTRVAQSYFTTATAYQSAAMAVKLTPVKDAIVGGVVWTASNSTGGFSNAYGTSSVLAMPVNVASGASATRFLFTGGAWVIVEGGV